MASRNYQGRLAVATKPTIDLDGVSYDLILVLADRLKKMLPDKPVHILIDAPRLPDSID